MSENLLEQVVGKEGADEIIRLFTKCAAVAFASALQYGGNAQVVATLRADGSINFNVNRPDGKSLIGKGIMESE